MEKKIKYSEDSSNRLIEPPINPYMPQGFPEVSKQQCKRSSSKKRILKPMTDQPNQEKAQSFIDRSKIEHLKTRIEKYQQKKCRIETILEPPNIVDASNSLHLPELTYKLSQRGKRHPISITQNNKRNNLKTRSKISTATSWYPVSPREASLNINLGFRHIAKFSCESTLSALDSIVKKRPSTSKIIDSNVQNDEDSTSKSNPNLKVDLNRVESSSPIFKTHEEITSLPSKSKKKTNKLITPSNKSKKIKEHIQVKLDKNRDGNLNTLLNNKGAYNFYLLMQEYVRRQGLPENTKIFILTGQHDFVRRALTARGWLENKHSSSRAYHLKWCYNDVDQDYKDLKAGQFFNHFLNNRELTTKSGLSSNLRRFIEYNVKIDEFFPRCYDLGDNPQIIDFKNDYQKTAILNLIKKSNDGKYVKPQILEIAVRYAENLLEEINDKCEKNPKTFRWDIRNDDLSSLINYWQSYSEIPNSKIDEGLNTKIGQLLEELNQKFSQFYMEGDRNIWIIKPGQNSRGSGVRCVSTMQEIIESGLAMQSRIVQKYIERPLLLPTSSGFCKFDIRQWVLVTSFDPLTIYYYNSNYLRLCQQAFTLNSLDPYIHLANYSIQKDVAKTSDDTVWELSKLVSLLKQKNISWEKDVLGNIHNIVIRTLQSVAEDVVSRPECFELYGFDIMIDENFKPWLLEVNLSPACSERTSWLVDMLNKMGDGLFRIVMDGEIQKPIYDEFGKVMSEITGDTQEWILLFKADYGNSALELSNTKGTLEIIGEKFNINKEKQKEKKFMMNRAALLIQKKAKKFLKKVREERKKQYKRSLVIQAIIRRKFGYEFHRHELENQSAIKIQSFFRMNQAIKEFNLLKRIRAVKKIQSCLLGCKSRIGYKNIIEVRSCIKIQTFLRKIYAVESLNNKKHYKKCIIIIQKFWKSIYRKRNVSAINIQRLWRGYTGRNLFRKKINYIRSVIKCQLWIKAQISKQIIKKLKIEKSFLIVLSCADFNLRLKSFHFYIFNNAATIIQKNVRRSLAISSFKRLKLESAQLIKAIKNIQKHIRGATSRLKHHRLKEIRSSLIIQRFYRGHIARKYFKILMLVYKSALKIQKNFRGFKARKRFKNLKSMHLQETERRNRMKKIKKTKKRIAALAAERLFNNVKEVSVPAFSNLDNGRYVDINQEFKADNLRITNSDFAKEQNLINIWKSKKLWERQPAVDAFVVDKNIYVVSDFAIKKVRSKSKKRQKKNSPYEIIFTKW